MRQCKEFETEFKDNYTDLNPKEASLRAKQNLKKIHHTCWMSKPQHSYLFKTREQIDHIDKEGSNYWLKKANLTSHEEGYYCAIQEEEINVRGLQQRRCKEKDNELHLLKCQVCHKEKETIQHVLACCERLRIPLYLPVRHNAVAKVVYKAITNLDGNEIREVYTSENFEIWWDTKITTKPALKHNKPDMVLWRTDEKKPYIIDVVVGLDTNTQKNNLLKLDAYLPLSIQLRRLYPDYSFEVLPIVVGATGLIIKSLRENITKIGICSNKIDKTIELCQKAALFGSMKIVKLLMNHS